MIRRSDTLERTNIPATKRIGWPKLTVVGSLLGALASMSCCILPLVLFAIGASGVWIGNLTALAPYQPVLIIATLGLLGYGFWIVYRRPAKACAEDQTCANPASDRLLKIGLWTATFVVAAAIAFPFVASGLLRT